MSESFTAGQGFEFVKNPNYWQPGLPRLDGVNGVVISEPSTKAQAVLSGDFDLIDPPDFATVPQFEKAKNIGVLKGPFGFAQDFGLAATKKPYDDPQVRIALRMLIDRDKFVKIVCRGQGTAGADTPINPRDPFFPEGLRPTAYDPERARSILKKAGHGDGWTDTVFTAPAFKGLNDSSVFLKQAFAEGGIKLNVQSLTTDAWAKHLQKTDGLVANYWARQHPSTMLAFMCSSKGVWNESFVKDTKIDKLLATAQSSKSFAIQKEAFGDAQRLYIAQSPTLWTSHYADYWPYKRRLSGVVLSPTDLVDFRRARLA
jgi:peptide/nickel transport system substrate-binding protein